MTVRTLDEENQPQSKTRSVTFRLNNSLIEELQGEAGQRDISMNVLVNQVLRRYRDWDRYEAKTGMMPVPKIMLSAIINMAVSLAYEKGIKDIGPFRDKIVKDAAQTAFLLMKDAVMFMKKDFDLWTVLSVLQEYMKVSGIESDHKIEPGDRHVFIIKHELGEDWSVFTKELMSIIFNNLASVKAEVRSTSNTVVAEVQL